MGNPELGKRIEMRRKQLNLTLDDVASEIGVAKSTIQRYEKGAIDKIKLPVVEAIARVLDVDPAWICCKTDEMRIMNTSPASTGTISDHMKAVRKVRKMTQQDLAELVCLCFAYFHTLPFLLISTGLRLFLFCLVCLIVTGVFLIKPQTNPMNPITGSVTVPLRSILSRGGFLFLRGTLLYHVVVCHPTSGIRFRSGSSAQISSHFGEIRTVEVNGEPWFVGKDVATILGYAKPLNAIATHIDEDDSLKQGLIDNMGRTQEMTIINESGLYSLILS